MRVIVSCAMVLVFLAVPAYAESVKWVGCDISLASFMNELVKAFEKEKGHRILAQDGGATRGIQDVVKGEAHMGGSCRIARDVKEERGVKLVPVAWDALVAITHPSNPVNNISLDQVRKVFTGQITNWRQLGGKDAPIEVFTRKSKMAGVEYGFRHLVFSDPEKDVTATRTFDSSRPLEEAVERSPNAIGITGVSSARLRPVKMLQLEGRTPTHDNVATGNYLLYRPLYLTVPEHPHPVVSEFVKFVFSVPGQAAVKATGTVTLSEGKRLWDKYKEQIKTADIQFAE